MWPDLDARAGRLTARKSGGTWLTTRSAVQALIVDLAQETRGRPRAQPAPWTEVAMTPQLAQVLEKIDQLRSELAGQVDSHNDDPRNVMGPVPAVSLDL